MSFSLSILSKRIVGDKMTEAKRRVNKKYAKSVFGRAQIKARRHKRTETLRLAFGGKCQDCTSTINLQFAHIKPTKLNGEGRLTDARNKDVTDHPDCYKLLCLNCHIKMDVKSGKWGRPKIN